MVSLTGVDPGRTLPIYDGIVAGSDLWQTITTAIQDSIHRKCFIPAVDVRLARFYFANIYQLELACPGTRQITAGVENTDGTFTQITFNGGSTSVTLNGGDGIWSDPVPIIWSRGNRSYVRTWTHSSNASTAGVLFSATYDRTNIGEWSDYGASGTIPDITLGGSPGTQHNLTYGPIAVRAYTNRPSIFVIADSRGRGSNSSGFSPSYNVDGEICPILRDNNVPYVNCSLGGEAGYLLAPGTSPKTIRTELAKWCTDYVCSLGINDFNNSRTDAQLQADLKTIYGFWTFATPTGKPRSYTVGTVTPYTTSTDSWATLVNQTVFNVTKETYRVAHNTQVRGYGLEYMTGLFDVASITESGSTGKWNVNGSANWYARTDGLHDTTTACTAIRDAKVLRVDPYIR